MLPDSGLVMRNGYWFLSLENHWHCCDVTRPSQWATVSCVLHRSLQLCWAAPDCLHTLLNFHPIHGCPCSMPSGSLCHPLSAGPKDTLLHPFSGAGLTAVAFLPCYPRTHLSDMLPLAWGFPAVFRLSGTGSLPFLLAHQHACRHFSAIFPTFALRFGGGVCCYFHFFSRRQDLATVVSTRTSIFSALCIPLLRM